jgi:hypothetical protein
MSYHHNIIYKAQYFRGRLAKCIVVCHKNDARKFVSNKFFEPYSSTMYTSRRTGDDCTVFTSDHNMPELAPSEYTPKFKKWANTAGYPQDYIAIEYHHNSILNKMQRELARMDHYLFIYETNK